MDELKPNNQRGITNGQNPGPFNKTTFSDRYFCIGRKMTQEEYLKHFKEECDSEYELTKIKNADYASVKDAFQNFRGIEILTRGRLSLEDGIAVRLTDKFQRLLNLIEPGRTASVKDESIDDTLRDISVYAKILRIYRKQQKLNNTV
jgi:hypothetical protein